MIDPVATPTSVEELSKIKFEFPRLPRLKEWSCPSSRKDVREYADMEFEADKIKFLRSYDIEDVHYWLWEATGDLGTDFVYVEKFKQSIKTGGGESHGLTPEQFLVREFLHNQYGRKRE